jgi:hypothetical protein
MNANELRRMLNHEPFEPFRIRLSSGDAYEVRDPDSVAVGRNRAFIFFTDRAGWTFFSYLHVAAVESLADGHRRGRKRG